MRTKLLRFFHAVFVGIFGAISVSFFGDLFIIISTGLISEIRNFEKYFYTILIALLFAGIPSFVAYFIMEFLPSKYRFFCAGIYALILGLYLEILFITVFKSSEMLFLWLLGSIISVAITEYARSTIAKVCKVRAADSINNT